MEPIRTGGRRFYDSYGLVLLLLLAAFLLTAESNETFWRAILIVVIGASILITYRSARSRLRRIVYIVIPVVTLIALVNTLVVDDFRDGPAALVMAALMTLGPLVILADILWRHLEVTLETILGALCVYMYLGLIAAFLFGFIDGASSEPFFSQGEVTQPGTYSYFSFVTMTTLGYGDLTPANEIGRQLAVLEAVIGQVYLVTLVARLVSMFRTVRPEPIADKGLRKAPEPEQT